MTFEYQNLKTLIVKVIDNRGKNPPLSDDGYEVIESPSLVGDNKYPTYDKIKKYVSEETYSKWFRAGHPVKDDILVSTVGNIGCVAIMDTNRGCLAQNIVGLRVNKFITNPHYLYYYLAWERTQQYLKKLDIGAAQPSIKVPHLLDIVVPLPQLAVQDKIASILSAYDDLIENNLKRIKILEEMAQIIYREWFFNFCFPGHEKVKMVKSEMGMIPEGWEVKKLGDVAQEIRRSTNPEEIDPNTPYFGLEHLPRKSITLSEWGTAEQIVSTKLSFKKGEILFGKIRPYFHKVGVAPIDGICSSDAIVIEARLPKYFGIVISCVSSEDFINHATKTSQGTKMPRADWKVLVKYPIAIPRSELLQEFNSIVNNIIDQLINFIFKNRNLRKTRDLLLPKLINGEIDVENLEINTESVQ